MPDNLTDPLFRTEHNVTPDGVFSFILPPSPDDMVEEETGDPTARLENESERAYAGFLAYLNMGQGKRSLIGAYKIYGGDTAAKERQDQKIAPRYFQQWSSEYKWVARCERYDTAVQFQERQAIKDKHKVELETYKDTLKRCSAIKMSFFYRIAGICHKRLTEYERRDLRAFEQQDTALGSKPLLPTPTSEYDAVTRIFARASAIVDSGFQAQSIALGVDTLLGELSIHRKREAE